MSTTKRQKINDSNEIKNKKNIENEIKYLKTLSSIRERCNKIYQLGIENKLNCFSIQLDKIDDIVNLLLNLLKNDYKNGDPNMVPFHSRWRHFEYGNINRISNLIDKWKNIDTLEKTRRLIDLTIISVLLDAGAGSIWKYKEPKTNNYYNRSEGLAIASLYMFESGIFSSNETNPYQVDSIGLSKLKADHLKKEFQIDDKKNPMVGCDGRTLLLKSLGTSLTQYPQYFSKEMNDTNKNIEKDKDFKDKNNKFTQPCRPGYLLDYLLSKANNKNEVSVEILFQIIIDGFSNMWPKKNVINNINMGDCWTHPKLNGELVTDHFVPFHKLSQWLTYSLMEPLKDAGLVITGLPLMTGLPEYRNGGLLIDMELLVPKKMEICLEEQYPHSEAVVEWRCLTVVLLDKIYEKILKRLNLTKSEFPLVKMLEMGSWKAGRLVAKKKRKNGEPPIKIISDGTVF